MVSIGSTLIIIVLLLVLFLAITAIIRGQKGLKASKCFTTTDKKVVISYKAVSLIHMLAGILIALFFVIAGILILIF